MLIIFIFHFNFKGGCLRYDAIEEILIAKPFTGGVNCWNTADWIVLLLPIYIFVYYTLVIIICLLPWSIIRHVVIRVPEASLPIRRVNRTNDIRPKRKKSYFC